MVETPFYCKLSAYVLIFALTVIQLIAVLFMCDLLRLPAKYLLSVKAKRYPLQNIEQFGQIGI